MKEYVQLCGSIKYKNKMFFILMASLSCSVQPNRNYTITVIWPSNYFIKNWTNNELMADSLQKIEHLFCWSLKVRQGKASLVQKLRILNKMKVIIVSITELKIIQIAF